MFNKFWQERSNDVLLNLSIGFAEGLKCVKRSKTYSAPPYPKHSSFEYYFYNHTGNLWEGFLVNTLTDIGLNYVVDSVTPKLKEGKLKNLFSKFQNNKYLTTGVATTLTSLAIVVDEFTGIITTPDVKDIPMGLAGILSYGLIRAYSIYKNKE